MADKSIHQRSKIYKKNSQRIGLLINTNNTKVLRWLFHRNWASKKQHTTLIPILFLWLYYQHQERESVGSVYLNTPLLSSY